MHAPTGKSGGALGKRPCEPLLFPAPSSALERRAPLPPKSRSPGAAQPFRKCVKRRRSSSSSLLRRRWQQPSYFLPHHPPPPSCFSARHSHPLFIHLLTLTSNRRLLPTPPSSACRGFHQPYPTVIVHHAPYYFWSASPLVIPSTILALFAACPIRDDACCPSLTSDAPSQTHSRYAAQPQDPQQSSVAHPSCAPPGLAPINRPLSRRR